METAELNKEGKKKVTSWVKKWQSKLYLYEWEFDLIYPKEDEGPEYAKVQMLTQYKRAGITIQPKFFKESDRAMEEIIVHELCHCIVQPLVQLAVDAAEGHGVSGREIDHWKESVTQHVTNVAFCKR